MIDIACFTMIEKNILTYKLDSSAQGRSASENQTSFPEECLACPHLGHLGEDLRFSKHMSFIKRVVTLIQSHHLYFKSQRNWEEGARLISILQWDVQGVILVGIV